MTVCDTLKDNGITPFALGQKDQWNATFWFGQVLASLAGYDEMQKMVSEKDKLNNDYVIETCKILKELAMEKGYLNPDALSYSEYEAHAFFYDEKAAMYYFGTWNFTEIMDTLGQDPDFKAFEYGVIPLPGVDRQVLKFGVNGVAGSSATKYPEEVKKFLKYWMSYENNLYLIETLFQPVVMNIEAQADSLDTMDSLSLGSYEILQNPQLEKYMLHDDLWKNSEYVSIHYTELQKVMWTDQTPEETAKNMNDSYSSLIE